MKCQFCEKVFAKFQSLGGHVSKAHPEKSEVYQKKKIRRDQREPERLLLKFVRRLAELEMPDYSQKQLQYHAYKRKQDFMKKNVRAGLDKFDTGLVEKDILAIQKRKR